MKQQGNLTIVLRLLRTAGLTSVGILVGVGLIGLLLGWRSLYQYGNALTWAGIILIIVAFLTGVGSANARREDLTAFSLTGAGDMNQHARRYFIEMNNRFGCLIVLLATGVVALIVGYLLQAAG